MKKYYVIFYLLFSMSGLFSQTVPGTLATPATVCANSNSGILTLSGYNGNIIRWEYSFNGVSLWTPIANTSATYNYIDLAQTTYFRVIVQAPSFAAGASNVVAITVNAQSEGGTASSANLTECTGNTALLSLGGYTGSILNWQYSINNGASWNPIASSNDSVNLHYPAITVNTLFRAVVQNGVCPSAFSDSVKVTVAPASVGGLVSAGAVVCAGSNGATLNLSGHTGTVVRWEYSSTGLYPWAVINNTTGSLTYSNLTGSTYYRAILKSANCPEAISDSVFIDVNANSLGGFITGTPMVCSNVNSGTLNLNGNNGTVVQWEYSVNSGATWNATPVNTSSYTFTNLIQNTEYRVEIVNGVCSSTYSSPFTVTVNPLPAVNFTFVTACEDRAVSFTNTSSGTNVYSWDFDDGSNAGIANPSHTYTSGGTYSVSLTATSSNGCIDSVSQNVIVYPKPQVSFTAVDSICGYNMVAFTNNSSIASGTITSYTWTFGDGSSASNAASPSHLYTNPNNYLIQLLATSNNGCSDSVSNVLFVSPKPIASFVVSNTCKKTAAAFSNNSFINGGGITYAWDFGDSQGSTLNSPSHLYANAGSYNVSLITTSNFGCRDTLILPLYINEQPDLLISTLSVCLGKNTVFSQTINPAISNYTLNWNFGDGNSVSGDSPVYVYPVSGNYQVQATLTSDSGCVSAATLITNIHPLPNLSYTFANVCSADSLHISNLSSISAGSLTWQWDFGNSTSSTVADPVILYSGPGSYIIQLIAISNNGCVDSLSKPVLIYDSPVSSFTFSNACDGNPIQFTNTSTVNSGTIATTNWNFGDNTNSTLTNPVKQYLSFGTYNVTLQAVSSNGCASSSMQTASVYEGPVANFSFVSQCAAQSIPFTNLTALSSGTYNSAWDFGDTTSSVLNSPVHAYVFDGTKQVKLVVTTNNGCVDSIFKFVQVYSIPQIFAGNDTTVSKGYPVQLNASGAFSYSWSPPDGLSNPAIANPVALPETTTAYIVYGNSANGCSSSDTIVITISDDFLVVPYNIITPDNNGKNDTWIIKNIKSYPANSVVILDEWGVEVYTMPGYDNSWDGRNKRGEILPDGTYYYVLTFEGSERVYKGFIALLRNK
ncbi:MAG: hypothetical protein K0S33_4148 [Bacteroidetes bacterium]|jgi:gliding motility-associated-like protein|nr:hypothetical protein [Bacteroidota bacterium]